MIIRRYCLHIRMTQDSNPVISEVTVSKARHNIESYLGVDWEEKNSFYAPKI